MEIDWAVRMELLLSKVIRPRRIERDALGRQGETRAALYYRLRGWRILGRNVREGDSEIDLVARRGDIVAFVEVKTRSAGSMGEPWEAVDPEKRSRVMRGATRFVRRHRLAGARIRFDVISICWTGYRFQLRSFPDAFQPMADEKRPWIVR